MLTCSCHEPCAQSLVGVEPDVGRPSPDTPIVWVRVGHSAEVGSASVVIPDNATIRPDIYLIKLACSNGH
jgi:hypothetical protein